jgi:hypothetical protein
MTIPQQYFPTCIKADILEDFKKRENVLKHPTEVSYSSKSPFSNLHTHQKSQNFSDVLITLPFAPKCIHKLQLPLSINQQARMT